MLSSIGVPPASRIPSLTLAPSARRWKLHGIVSIHVLATRDERLAQRLVVVADALQVGARGGALGAFGERAAAVLEVAWGAESVESVGDVIAGRLSRERSAPQDAFSTPGVLATRCGGDRAGSAEGVPPRDRRAASRMRARAPTARAARGRAAPAAGSNWRPGRCMFAVETSRCSSPVSAIHLASTSSESGSRALPYGRVSSGNVDAVLVEQAIGLGQVGDDRLVRVDQVRVGGAAGAAQIVGSVGERAPHAEEAEVAVHRPLLLVDARAQQRPRPGSARRSRPGSYDQVGARCRRALGDRLQSSSIRGTIRSDSSARATSAVAASASTTGPLTYGCRLLPAGRRSRGRRPRESPRTSGP